MEQTLFRLFDFQRFAKNSSLQHIIDASETHIEGCLELEDDDLLNLAAAGDSAALLGNPSQGGSHDRNKP